jgi:hypothetical protein
VFGATSASCLDSEGQLYRGRGGHDRMVVGFIITYAISAKLIFNEMMMRSPLFLTNMLSWIFIVLAH